MNPKAYDFNTAQPTKTYTILQNLQRNDKIAAINLLRDQCGFMSDGKTHVLDLKAAKDAIDAMAINLQHREAEMLLKEALDASTKNLPKYEVRAMLMGKIQAIDAGW